MPIRLRFRRALTVALAVIALAVVFPLQGWGQVYAGRPKLIIIIVIDQFRGDYLNRDRAKFREHGFNLFMKQGAWFTNCYFDYANTKTAPGHATIGTGAYTDGHGIDSNDWWDASRSYDVPVSSVEDERYQLVDLPAASLPANQPGAPEWAAKFVVGASPLNLRATTLGDELRLATQGRSRVFGISLKDRAAILPTGQSANAAYWIDGVSGQFTTSTYYMEHLPQWVRDFNASGRNQQAEREANVDTATTEFYELVGEMPAANSYEFDFAKALIDGEKLGQNGVTDLVVISLSANDILGHEFGPDSDFQEKMILSLDQDLAEFDSWLDRKIGLNNVWLALTADHGIAPVPGEAARLGINAYAVNMRKMYKAVNAQLSERYSRGEQVSYLLPDPDNPIQANIYLDLPYIVLDQRAFKKAGVDEKTAEDAVAELLREAVDAQNANPLPEIRATIPPPVFNPLQQRVPPAPRVQYVYTRLGLENGQLPPTEWGRLLGHSVTDHGNWYVMVVLDAYQLPGTGQLAGTTHFSPWNYDRHVPLAFYGTPFKPGEYDETVEPVDLAVTFASLAGVNRPSAAVGRVLVEALKPTAPPASTPAQ
jgi:predicted AlkP superfamily pyrophosphatase or phosphodiesterase